MTEPSLDQEENNILHNMLLDYRHWVEGCHIEGKIPGQLEVGNSGDPEDLWTAAQQRVFKRFNATPLTNYSIEEN